MRLSILLSLVASMAVASDRSKPPVPPGNDPGGVAVAILETGADYTMPAIANYLARDGEGEIIGWDVTDNDRRPYKSADDLEEVGYMHRGTAMARTVLKRAKSSRLELIRLDTSDDNEVRKALSFVAQTPAKIVVLALQSSKASLWATVRDAMQSDNAKFLLIAAAGEGETDHARIKEHFAPSLDQLDNVVVVTACDSNGNALTTADGAPTNADVAVNTEAFTAELLNADMFQFKPEASIAAAEIAAFAARLTAKDPRLTPAEIKLAIVSAAKPYAAGDFALAKSGWIAEPWKHFPNP